MDTLRYGHKKLNFACKKKVFFSENVCLSIYKIRFALKKKLKIFLGDFKFQKLYMGLHDKHFFQKKNKNLGFFITTLFLLESNRPRN